MKKILGHTKTFLLFLILCPLLVFGVFNTALLADTDVDRKAGGLQSFPVGGGETIYKGALVCVDTNGYLVPAADTAGLKFVGLAYENKTNTSAAGYGDDGELWCRVYTEGAFKLTCTGITQVMVGQPMYVADSGSVDDTSTNDIYVGMLVEFVGTTEGWVDIGQRALAAGAVQTAHLAADAVTKAKLHEDICYIKLQRITAVVREILAGNDLAWTDLDLDTYVTVPTGAIAIILETYVIDTGAARPTLSLRKNGEDTNSWQEIRNSAQVAGIAHETMAIVEFDDDHIIEYRLQSTAGGGTASFYLKLLGWVMQP